jgi:hypothetical protein
MDDEHRVEGAVTQQRLIVHVAPILALNCIDYLQLGGARSASYHLYVVQDPCFR